MELKIRKILEKDNVRLKFVIQSVFVEHGINKPGTAYFDESLNDMYSNYTGENKIYFVVLVNDVIVGGAGIFPTEGLPNDTCELVKMYLLSEFRGNGIGRLLIENCIQSANDLGFKKIYLETLPELESAIKMYEKFEFKNLKIRLGNSGHHACNLYMIKEI